MTWIQHYRMRSYIRDSVWLFPVVGMVTAWGFVNALSWIERRAGWQSNVDPDAARALFGTPAGAMFTFIVFLSSTLLLDCVVELVPQVGDFVAFGSPLFRIHGGHSKPSASALRNWIALGPERTMERDPAFSFRILVDIASKALSRETSNINQTNNTE